MRMIIAHNWYEEVHNITRDQFFFFSNPTATIFFSDAWKDVMAPTVVSFSSRGPNPISPDILKVIDQQFM